MIPMRAERWMVVVSDGTARVASANTPAMQNREEELTGAPGPQPSREGMQEHYMSACSLLEGTILCLVCYTPPSPCSPPICRLPSP